MGKEKYKVIIPERIYIVPSLEEAARILKEHHGESVSIRLLKDED